MAIKYFKYKRKIYFNGEVKEKFMPQMQVEAPVGFEQIAEMIEKKSTMSRGDVMGVLAEVESTACYMLEKGHPVKLGILGTFFPSIETKSVDSPEKVTSRLIKRLKILFKPSTYLKKRLKNVSFELGDNRVREVKNKNI